MTPRFTTAGIFKGALLGGAAAAVVCEILFFIGKAAGAGYVVLQPGKDPMPVPVFQPILNCVVGGLFAALTLSALNRFVPTHAWKIFLVIAALIFVLFSGLAYMTFANDTTTVAFLELMHIPAAAGIVGGIWRFGRSEASELS